MLKLQLTLAIIKPHALKNPVAFRYIRNVLKKQFVVVETKRLLLTQEAACKFYQEHVGKFFYNRLVTFMTSGCCDIHIMAHPNAIQAWRETLGPTKVFRALYDSPDTLRGMFGLSDTRNVAHGSDSLTSVQREISFFFPEFSFENWHKYEEPLYRLGPLHFDPIKQENASKLNCKLIAEGANGPATPAADIILHEKKILVLPDLLTNAGGVTVSYFEYLKDINQDSFSKLSIKFWCDSNTALLDSLEKSLLNARICAKIEPTPELESMMGGASDEHIVNSGLEYSMTNAAAEKYDLGWNIRSAAYITAIEKIFTTFDEQGLAF